MRACYTANRQCRRAVGVRGLNDYTKVTASNDAMKGQYYGYDGPCPPWNDELVHHYHFTVYALSVKSLDLPAGFRRRSRARRR